MITMKKNWQTAIWPLCVGPRGAIQQQGSFLWAPFSDLVIWPMSLQWLVLFSNDLWWFMYVCMHAWNYALHYVRKDLKSSWDWKPSKTERGGWNWNKFKKCFGVPPLKFQEIGGGYVCMCVYVSIYLCMYVCMHICMYVCVCMVWYGIALHCTALHLYCIYCIYCIVLRCIVLYCIVLYCTVLCCIVLYCTVCMSVCLYVCMCVCMYGMVLYDMVWYGTALHCIALHCIVLYLLYCIVLYCIVLYGCMYVCVYVYMFVYACVYVCKYIH